MEIVARHLLPRLHEALDGFRAVVLHGPRQCGKSTLARLLADQRGGTYASLDDEATRDAAVADPHGFLLDQAHPLVVDEIQLGGDRVVRALKQIVDADPARGRFLLTGSTNFLTVPTISESLAGRVRILRLWPLSQAELAGCPAPGVWDWIEGFETPARTPAPAGSPRSGRRACMSLVCRGGFPEVVAMGSRLRPGWFESYVETVIERDVVALGDLRRRSVLVPLVRWIAASTSSELNVQAVSSRLGVDRATMESYLDWIETVFLMHRLPAWSRRLPSRAVRRPKIHVTDTGLAASLLGVGPNSLTAPTSPSAGPLFESFAVNEMVRQLSASRPAERAHHYRDHDGREVDLLLESPDGAVTAVEIKATSSPRAEDLRHVAWLRDRLDAASGGDFRAGVLLHTGQQHLTVGDRLYLRPVQSLWATSPTGSPDRQPHRPSTA